MSAAPKPPNEAARLAALHAYEVLDSACEDSFDNIARMASRLTGSPMALITLIDSERQWLKARVGVDVTETHRDQAFCAHALLEPDKALVVTDATTDARFADNPFVTGDPNIRFYAGVPLVNPEGFALGTLCILDRSPRDLPPDMLETLKGLGQTVVTTLELRRAMIRSRNLAMTDALTGLANRPAFVEALCRALSQQKRSGAPFALLYCDLDGFKRVNDVHGHAMGDRLLREVADVLRGCVRREDTPARVGGDEFAVVLVGGEGADTHAVAERLRAMVKDHMDKAGWPVTVSIGAVSFVTAPDDESEAIEVADALMYSAKNSGSNRVVSRDYDTGSRLLAG
ncbi:diguanylate cyclase [Humitalea sp. 24SJ18S-53]|uniref:GGDEF domain-containing protein n=1 Tax=Humitalea sp. 24SJ18S-53 TaxID=3422307 RepID=UPI003D675C54